jgi:hypothetical protein
MWSTSSGVREQKENQELKKKYQGVLDLNRSEYDGAQQAARSSRCGGQFFNGFFGTWDQATNLTSHSKSTKQPLNY